MSTNKCVKCQGALEAGARFCGGCGTQQPGAVIPQAAVRTNNKTMFQGSSGTPVVAKPNPVAKADVAYDRTIAPGTTPAPVLAPKPQPVAKPAPAPEPFDGDLT